MSAPPRHRFVEANGLRHHLVEWSGAGPPVLLLHGFLEHARVWDWVAPRLADTGFRPIAVDWRGHGDSEWVGRGGYYHFADYVADLAGLVRHAGGRAALVAHSMGSNAAILYAGSEPERVTALVCVDALGPPDADPATAPTRYRTWIEQVARVTARSATLLGLEDAADKIHERFPRFGPAVSQHMALHGSRAAGPGRVWKFDPRHQTQSPTPYYVRQARAFWQAVQCPVLFVGGGESPFKALTDEMHERFELLRAERVEVPDTGHHPHLEDPDGFCERVTPFLRRHLCAD